MIIKKVILLLLGITFLVSTIFSLGVGDTLEPIFSFPPRESFIITAIQLISLVMFLLLSYIFTKDDNNSE